jgi:glycosyltransferase involved in cell wall biosynthesis
MAGFKPSLAHRLWRLLPAQGRRRAFAVLTARAAPKPSPVIVDPAPGLAVAGELSRASGLGEGARLMLRGLERLGVASWPVDVGPPVDRSTAQVPFNSGPMAPPGVGLVLHVNPPMLPLAMMRLGARAVRGRKVVGYWAWELPVTPPEWRVGVDFVHEVWVPSRFTAEAVEPLLPGRVRIVRPPLAIVPPTPAPMGREALGLPTDAVVVLTTFNLASSFVRKNPIAAVHAFRQAFGSRMDRLLVLKVTNSDHFASDFAQLRAAVGEAPNIRIETRLMPAAELAALTVAADIVLSLHRSEGLGLVLAEAMLLGRPIVCTGWSGNLDFMDPTCAALIPCRLVVPQDPRGVLDTEDAVWADPEVEAAAAQLRRLADDRAERERMGEAALRMARARFGPDTFLEALRGIGAV